MDLAAQLKAFEDQLVLPAGGNEFRSLRRDLDAARDRNNKLRILFNDIHELAREQRGKCVSYKQLGFMTPARFQDNVRCLRTLVANAGEWAKGDTATVREAEHLTHVLMTQLLAANNLISAILDSGVFD